jgi:thiamine phosphate synthase YjbQ (UPF0047 family)
MFNILLKSSSAVIGIVLILCDKLMLMRLAVIYRQNSDHARSVYEFKEMMRRRYPDKQITEYELDTRDGAAEAHLYGVVSYPAIIVTANNGKVLGAWEGLPLPLIDEVAGLLLEEQGAMA